MIELLMRWFFWLLFLLPAQCFASSVADQGLLAEGKYLFQLANCYGCHTDVENDGEPLAGGRRLETEFGTFITPNITPDKTAGIGNWTDQQFIDAIRHGISPDGSNYYPAFPYPSYQRMKTGDLLALKAYLMSLPASTRTHPDHELKPYLFRSLMPVWNLLNNYLQSRQAVSISRGAYLIDTLGHCHECHTPRNLLGMLQMDKKLQGNESLSSPDISQSTNGIGDWSDNELTELFIEGVLPDGDYVADHMAEVVEFSTSKWNSEDLSAAINYLRSIK